MYELDVDITCELDVDTHELDMGITYKLDVHIMYVSMTLPSPNVLWISHTNYRNMHI